MKLDDLIGLRSLDAVDSFIEQVKDYGDHFQDADAIRFRLDGITYTAVEDPSDGYRSCMGELFASPDAKVWNVFPAIKVMGIMKPRNDYENDTLQLIDVITGKVVMEVGTDNTDDYYPWFVASFWPENMATNAAND